jgi:hypothetical protein
MAHKLTFIVYWRKVQPLHCRPSRIDFVGQDASESGLSTR